MSGVWQLAHKIGHKHEHFFGKIQNSGRRNTSNSTLENKERDLKGFFFKLRKMSQMNQNCKYDFSSWSFCFQSLVTVLESQEAYSDSNPRILTLDEFEEKCCHSIAECTEAVQHNKKLLGNTVPVF